MYLNGRCLARTSGCAQPRGFRLRTLRQSAARRGRPTRALAALLNDSGCRPVGPCYRLETEVGDENDERSRVRVPRTEANRRDWRVAKAEGAWIQYGLQASAR